MEPIDLERDLDRWLAALPPDEPPPGFYDRIDAALGLTPARPERAKDEPPRGGRVRSAARAASWAVRAPAAAVRGNGAFDGVRAGLAGLSAARYALGPLAPSRKPPKRKRPLWQRALGL